MKSFQRNSDKNAQLIVGRRVSFQDVIAALARGDLLDILEHPNPQRYARQQLFVVRIRDYANLVPFVEDGTSVFLKTIIPSRKATRRYLATER